MKPRSCELCIGEASLYCESDSAFLCWACDARVHEANFLVARHVRTLVCADCRGLDPDSPVSGVGFRPVFSVCHSCESAAGLGMSSSSSHSSSLSSFSCISSAESAATTVAEQAKTDSVKISVASTVPFRPVKAACLLKSTMESDCSNRIGRRKRRAQWEVDARVEGVLVNLCRRLGLEGNSAALGVAKHALCVGIKRMTGIPFRVCAVAAVWFAAKLCVERNGRRTGGGLLKRLEECSGVPAKFIVLTESKLSRILKSRHVEEEGWAECC